VPRITLERKLCLNYGTTERELKFRVLAEGQSVGILGSSTVDCPRWLFWRL